MADAPLYDLESVYDEQISPLMAQIIDICRKHRLPMVADFQYQNTEEQGAGFCTTVLVGGTDFYQSEKLEEAAQLLRPRRPVWLAETITTNPDGSRSINIRRVT